ncbi:X-box-binding protein 1-like isoform X2 [Xenopus laevis]|uniref:X-box-binding protein 1 n=1 Tax=Xenopus laevis TaxID=8355 RepID=A0A8J1M3R5_XENLA|nr:X-box-binding protein 1-like isoform X2 [Xenopus laevis]
MPGSREQTPRGSHSIGFSFQQPLANGNAAITDVSRTNQWGGDTPGRYEWVVSQRESNSYPANAVIPPPCLPICPTDSLHPLEMVVVGAPKVIFIPGNQCEQADALGSLMLPVSSPGSPESASNEQPPRKRQRLTHLTPEEKALRRKLKNRVAAQTARDRKKAKMGELEQQVIDLEIENEKLLLENQILRDKSHGLLAENQELRQRLGLSTLELKKEESSSSSQELNQSRKDKVRPETGSAESAALRLRAPLQQEQAQMSPNLTVSTWILTALTLQTLSLISCWAFWKAWTQTCCLPMKEHLLEAQMKRSRETNLIPYPPPHLLLWGPHQPSWRPLMN